MTLVSVLELLIRSHMSSETQSLHEFLSSCQLKVMEHCNQCKEAEDCFPDLKDEKVVQEMEYEPASRIISMLRWAHLLENIRVNN